MTYRQIYKYRYVWMTFAIFLIVFLHAPYKFESLTMKLILKNIELFCIGGVDIFVFSSGLGCAFSYSRTNNLFEYMKKRLLRLYPSYLLFMLMWIPGYSHFIEKMPVRFMIGNILGVQHFAVSRYAINWYFPFMLLMYFFSPFFIELIRRAKKIYRFLIIFFILLLFPVPFYGHFDYIIMAARLPIYAIGIYFALHLDGEKTVPKMLAVFLGAALVFGVFLMKYFYNTYDSVHMYRFGLWWFPFIFITPGLCFLISWICEKISSLNLKITGKIRPVVAYISGITLELFLVHIFFFMIYEKLYPETDNLAITVVALLSFAVAILLKSAADFLKNKLKLR